MLCNCENALPKLLQASYMSCGGRATLLKTLQACYTLAVVKMHSTNFCKPPKHFVEIKTHSPKLCKTPTCFAVVKIDRSNLTVQTSESVPHGLQWTKHTVRSFPSLLLVKTDPTNFCKLPTHFSNVKTHSPSLCTPTTHFEVDKMHSLKLCMPPTRIAVVKTHPPKLCMSPTCVGWSKYTLHVLRW